MKLVSLLIALCFTVNVFASTGSLQAFEVALDEYQYAMSVEWDQQDQNFQTAKTKEFINKIQTEITKGSLSQQDIINVLEKKIHNKALVEALKLKVSLSGTMTMDQLMAFMHESSDDFYSQGASWNGYVIIPAILLGAVVALGFAMWFSATHGCQEYAQTCDQFGCRNNYDVCNDYGYVGPHL